jgi:hypothetical protein
MNMLLWVTALSCWSVAAVLVLTLACPDLFQARTRSEAHR